MFKVYKSIPAYPILKLSANEPGHELFIRGSITTDDEELQARIEKSAPFKRRWLKIDEIMTKGANEGVSKSDMDEISDGVSKDEVIQPVPGRVYAMNDLLQMKVPQLRGVLGKMGVTYTGLNKQALISSILNGKRMDQ